MELKQLPAKKDFILWDNAIKASCCFSDKEMVCWDEYKNEVPNRTGDGKLKGSLKKLVNTINAYQEDFTNDSYDWNKHTIFSDLEYAIFNNECNKIQNEIENLKDNDKIDAEIERQKVIYDAKRAIV